MSSSPPKTSSADFQDSESDDDQEASFNSQTRKSFSTDPQNTVKNQTLVEDSPNQPIIVLDDPWSKALPRPQKPSAFIIKKVMSESLLVPPGTLIKTRMPAPHLRKFQNQEKGTATGNSRNVESSEKKRIVDVYSGQKWWKRNLRKEMADMILMPPPPPRKGSLVDKKVQAPDKSKKAQEELKRKVTSQEENENESRLKKRRLKQLEYDQSWMEKSKLKALTENEGEENGFLFSLSGSESEDDYVTLKLLSAYISNGVNGENLAPEFAIAFVDFINGNGVLPKNCKITVPQYEKKVEELRKKFLNLVQQNGGLNFSEADFCTGRDYEMAKLCSIVWGLGSFDDLKSDVGQGRNKVKLFGNVESGVKVISLGGAGVVVDLGHGSFDQGLNVGHGNGAGPGMNVDHGNGADPGVDVDGSNGADPGAKVDHDNGADPGMNVDHGDGANLGVEVDRSNGADPGVKVDHGNGTEAGASADQKEDVMDVDRL